MSEIESGFNLSPQQRRWLALRAAGLPLPWAELAVVFPRSVERAQVERAWKDTVVRHESLRTRFLRLPGLSWPVQSPTAPEPLPLFERSGADPGQVEAGQAELDALFAEIEAEAGADDFPAPRVAILRLADRLALLIALPVLVADRLSLDVLARDLGAAAASPQGAERDLPVQLIDYSEVLAGLLEDEEGEAQQGFAYWAGQGVPVVGTSLAERPADGGKIGRSFASDSLATAPGDPILRLRPSALLAAWAIAYGRSTGDLEPLLAMPFGGRILGGLEGAVGPFERILPLKVAVRPEAAFTELDRELQARLDEHARWQDAFVWERLGGDGATLFPVGFDYEEADAGSVGGLEILRRQGGREPAVLGLRCLRRTEGLVVRVDFEGPGLDRASAARFARRFLEAARWIADRPASRVGEVRIVSAVEAEELIAGLNRTEVDLGAMPTLSHQIAGQASAAPDRIAVAAGGRQLSYAALEQSARAGAAALVALGVGRGSRVGIAVGRSIEAVVALLAIQRIGAAHVFLDPAFPEDRLAFVVRDAEVGVAFVEPGMAGRLALLGVAHLAVPAPGGELISSPISAAGPDDLAYVIYTSGSSGRPKGVAVSHRAILNRLLWILREFPQGEEDRILQKTSWSFDASIWELFAPLIAGARLVLAEPGAERDSAALVAAVIAEGITVLQLVPSMLGMVLGEPSLGKVSSLRRLFCGGEVLSGDLCARWQDRVDARLVNLYGPTEVAIDATFHPVRREDAGSAVPIGRPIANDRIYLVDPDRLLVPWGADGELLVGGAGLARGYLGRPDLTAQRFVPDPYSGDAGSRLYATGDRARYDAHGVLEFLGRIDDQIKIRGYRIEPREVESVLREAAGVREAAVVVREETPGDLRLVGFFVAAEEGPEGEDLRAWLKARLPDYMMPAALVPLAELPRLPSGKLDRKALVAMPLSRLEAEAPPVHPRTPVEELLALLWRDLLGVERIGVEDDFFSLGGHSLLAIQLLARIRETFGVELNLRALFQATKIADQAREIEAVRRAGGGAPPPAISLASRDRALPLSFGQERLWFLQQLEPLSFAYNIPMTLKLEGRLALAAFDGAIAEVVRRHEILRTIYRRELATTTQKILAPPRVRTPVVDLAAIADPRATATARAIATAEAHRPFDLEIDLPWRVTLVAMAPDRWLLLLTLHHIASDGWSMGVLIEELGTIYASRIAGTTPDLAPPPIQYADFAAFQRAWLEGDVLTREIDHWRRMLPENSPSLDLAADRPRPAHRTTEGDERVVVLSRELSAAVEELGRRLGATPFMTLLAAFAALLTRRCGRDDLQIGTVVAGRDRIETERLIGFFVNTLVLRLDRLQGSSFSDTILRARETMLDAHLHQDLPFEKLVEELRPDRSLNQMPLFQVLFTLRDGPREDVRLPDLRLTNLGWTEISAKFDLMLAIDRGKDSLSATATYWTALFDGATIVRILRQYETLLVRMIERPDRPFLELSLLGPTERHQLLVEWNDTRREYPRDATVDELFRAVCRERPGAVALLDGSREVTYGELDAWSNRWAWSLRRRGVGPEILVGIHLERSIELVVGVLAILKAGGGYLPLDPGAPSGRLAFQIENGGVRWVLTCRALADELPRGDFEVIPVDGDADLAGESAEPPPSLGGQENLAYVLYTSGSTGEPRGVAVAHRSVIRLVRETGYARFAPDETFLLLARFSFDASTFELWGALLSGARLAIVPDAPTLHELEAAIQRFSVSVLWLTAGMFHQMVEGNLSGLRGVRRLIAGGDVLAVPQVKKVLDGLPGMRLINGYGPTEGTTFTCCYDATSGTFEASVPIGPPIANTRVYVVDPEIDPVPLGVPGELAAAGDGLARGYWRRPELTAERFVPDPFSADPGGRLYRTGDLARHRADGALEFLGRRDLQVKIRGFRIELGEIEGELLHHPLLREVAVVARGDASGARRLIAYHVGDPAPSARDLRVFLAERLPDYMIPAFFVPLDRLPLNANGKVDRAALPEPAAPEMGTAATYVGPRDLLELELVQTWEEVLGVRPVGIADDFFQLGGHSLLAVRLIAEIRKRFGCDLSLLSLFEEANVRRQAELLRGRAASSVRLPLVPILPGGTKRPFFCVHPGGGGVLGYIDLAYHLGLQQPFFGLQARGWQDGLDPLASIEEMAEIYLAAIRSVQPSGPYRLGGWSLGGLIAYELASTLVAQGDEVEVLALLDASAEKEPMPDDADLIASILEEAIPLAAESLRTCGDLDSMLVSVMAQARERGLLPDTFDPEEARRYYVLRRCNMEAAAAYVPRPYAGPVTLFRAEDRPATADPTLGWGALAVGGLEIVPVPGRHENLIHRPQVAALASRLGAILDRSPGAAVPHVPTVDAQPVGAAAP